MSDHLILALETSSTICGAAMIKGQDCLASREEEMPRKHAEIIPSFVAVSYTHLTLPTILLV